MTGRTDILLKEVKEVLEWDILKFWSGMQDPRGGFYGKIAEGLAADKDADREEQLNARIIWAFSNAYRLFHKKEYLMPAMNGKDYLQAAVQQAVVVRPCFALGHKITGAAGPGRFFGLMQRAEHVDAGPFHGHKDGQPLLDRFRHVRLKGFPAQHGGRSGGLHLDAGARKILRGQHDPVCTGHLELRFSKDWSLVPSGCMFGLDLEASWSIIDAAYAIQDMDVINHVKDTCLQLYRSGMDGMSGDGYVVLGKDSDGEIDSQMVPWVQAEALIANLCAWKYQSVPEGADYAMRIWDFIKEHLNDTVDTIAFRMYPMHDVRACVQVLNIFR